MGDIEATQWILKEGCDHYRCAPSRRQSYVNYLWSPHGTNEKSSAPLKGAPVKRCPKPLHYRSNLKDTSVIEIIGISATTSN